MKLELLQSSISRHLVVTIKIKSRRVITSSEAGNRGCHRCTFAECNTDFIGMEIEGPFACTERRHRHPCLRSADNETYQWDLRWYQFPQYTPGRQCIHFPEHLVGEPLLGEYVFLVVAFYHVMVAVCANRTPTRSNEHFLIILAGFHCNHVREKCK